MPWARPHLALLLGLALASGPGNGARAEDALAQVVASGILTVGPGPLSAPVDEAAGGRLAGFDADLLDEIGKELGVGIRWIAAPADSGKAPEAEAPVLRGPVVLSAAVLRRFRALPPVVDVGDALLKRRGDGSLQKPADVAGKSVGAVTASPSLPAIRAFARTLHARISIRAHRDAEDVYADLAAGRVAAAVGDLPALAAVAKARPETFEVVQPSFGPKTFLGFVVAPDADHAALANRLAAVILKIRSDGRLAALQSKWFGLVFDMRDDGATGRP